MPPLRWRTTALLLAALAVLPLAIACGGDKKDDDNAGAQYMGAIVTPPIEKPDAVLMDENGQPFDLRKETEGYVTLLYVGYTHCPDICPTHLYEISEALKKVDPDVRKQVKVVFATADPERDTPQQLKQYLDTFDPDFIGLTGTRDLMDQFQIALGLQPATRTDLGGGNYAVNHAAYVMAFTKDNYAYTVYPSGMGQKEWLNDLPLLVKKGFRTE
ncbi:SCO family protein [Tepidiforma sp.]|uniref:SCO family protein n=1 Tax=Tepidiforma sp. TaxID=2682230 RepID=UPI002624FD74|nr:SCO family protein [Tepidiforma sp.]MCX7617018.1 SCO family protein [Tepidiforma sp.]